MRIQKLIIVNSIEIINTKRIKIKGKFKEVIGNLMYKVIFTKFTQLEMNLDIYLFI